MRFTFKVVEKTSLKEKRFIEKLMSHKIDFKKNTINSTITICGLNDDNYREICNWLYEAYIVLNVEKIVPEESQK